MQVILLGVDSPIGLSVIRELAGHGVDVHGLAWSRAGIGLYSRHLKRGLIRARDEDALISQLNALAGETGCRWLMTVSENDILMLHRRRADLHHLTPLIPPLAAFHRVLDKAETFAVARKLGIRTPHTWQITHSSDINALAANLRFPVVLKWANPQAVRAPLASIGQTLDKYRYLHDLDELQRYLTPLDAISQYPLIQEYCPGQGLGQMLYLHEGKPLLRFQHLRLREYPPEGGVSAVCAATTIDEQRMAGSIALLNALEWEGPAMVEYRYDPQSDSVCLMEINGRFWGSQPLALHSGAHFAWFMFSVGALGTVPDQITIRTDLQARFFIPELRRLLRVLFRNSLIQDRSKRFNRFAELARFLIDYLDPRSRYYVFSVRDPLPFFADLWFSLTQRFR